MCDDFAKNVLLAVYIIFISVLEDKSGNFALSGVAAGILMVHVMVSGYTFLVSSVRK